MQILPLADPSFSEDILKMGVRETKFCHNQVTIEPSLNKHLHSEFSKCVENEIK